MTSSVAQTETTQSTQSTPSPPKVEPRGGGGLGEEGTEDVEERVEKSLRKERKVKLGAEDWGIVVLFTLLSVFSLTGIVVASLAYRKRSKPLTSIDIGNGTLKCGGILSSGSVTSNRLQVDGTITIEKLVLLGPKRPFLLMSNIDGYGVPRYGSTTYIAYTTVNESRNNVWTWIPANTDNSQYNPDGAYFTFPPGLYLVSGSLDWPYSSVGGGVLNWTISLSQTGWSGSVRTQNAWMGGPYSMSVLFQIMFTSTGKMQSSLYSAAGGTVPVKNIIIKLFQVNPLSPSQNLSASAQPYISQMPWQMETLTAADVEEQAQMKETEQLVSLSATADPATSGGQGVDGGDVSLKEE